VRVVGSWRLGFAHRTARDHAGFSHNWKQASEANRPRVQLPAQGPSCAVLLPRRPREHVGAVVIDAAGRRPKKEKVQGTARDERRPGCSHPKQQAPKVATPLLEFTGGLEQTFASRALGRALSELIHSETAFPGRRSSLAVPWAFPSRSFGTSRTESCG
jgi:hypothetical protein